MIDLFNKNKATLISEIDKSIFYKKISNQFHFSRKKLQMKLQMMNKTLNQNFELMNMREHEPLMSRRKGARITKAHADFLLKILNRYPEQENLICRMYCIFTSTFKDWKGVSNTMQDSARVKNHFEYQREDLVKLFVKKLLALPKPSTNFKENWVINLWAFRTGS